MQKSRSFKERLLNVLTAHTPDSVGRLHARKSHYSKRPTLPLMRDTYGHIWPCSLRGLPCRTRYLVRGALLPHHFTLTRRRYVFCGTFRPHGFYTVQPLLSQGAFPCGVRKFLLRQSSQRRLFRPSNGLPRRHGARLKIFKERRLRRFFGFSARLFGSGFWGA